MTQKTLNGVANAIDTSEDHPVMTTIKTTLQTVASKIDTSNRIIEQTTKVQNAVSDFVKDTATKIGNKVVDSTFKALKTIVGWSKQK